MKVDDIALLLNGGVVNDEEDWVTTDQLVALLKPKDNDKEETNDNS